MLIVIPGVLPDSVGLALLDFRLLFGLGLGIQMGAGEEDAVAIWMNPRAGGFAGAW
jgi:hypothetical protein